MLKYMLDTDTCIYAINRKPPHLKRLFNVHIGQLCISSVTWGELTYGAEKPQMVERNLLQLEGLGSRLKILDFGVSEATQFGQIKAELEKKGEIIGAYDMMIAGHARSKGLVLLTNNQSEFMRVSGLRTENWLET